MGDLSVIVVVITVLTGIGAYVWYLRKQNSNLQKDLDSASGVATITTKRVDAIEASTLDNEKKKRRVEDSISPSARAHLDELRKKYTRNKP